MQQELLVNLDRLAIGTVWRHPQSGGLFKKVTPYSHLDVRTGELVFDKRLYGQDSEPLYVTEAR